MAPQSGFAVRTLDLGAENGWVRDRHLRSEQPEHGGSGVFGSSLVKEDSSLRKSEAILRGQLLGKVEIVLSHDRVGSRGAAAKGGHREIGREIARLPADRRARRPHRRDGRGSPRAVISLEALAQRSDFLCVGTNDLIQ